MNEYAALVVESVRERVNGSDVVVLEVTGDLDLSVLDRFERALGEATAQRPAAVLFDLTNVAFIDSSGLRALLFAAHDLQEGGCTHAVVAAAGSQVVRLLELAEVEDRLHRHETREEALRALVPGGGA